MFLFFKQSRKFKKFDLLSWSSCFQSSYYFIHQKERFSFSYYAVCVLLYFSLHWWAEYLSQVITWTTRVVYPVSVDFSTWFFFYWYWSICKFLKTFKNLSRLLTWDKTLYIVRESDTWKLLVYHFSSWNYLYVFFVAFPPLTHTSIQWGSFWMLLLSQQCMKDRSEV